MPEDRRKMLRSYNWCFEKETEVLKCRLIAVNNRQGKVVSQAQYLPIHFFIFNFIADVKSLLKSTQIQLRIVILLSAFQVDLLIATMYIRSTFS